MSICIDSAVIDTVDHAFPLRRLEGLYGILGPLGTASEATSLTSTLAELNVDVSQMLCTHKNEMKLIAEKHGVSILLYANDRQVYAV